MIYILIGRDDNTGDEWVRAEMFFDASLAVADCQRLNNTVNNATYRIETAENHVERKAKIDGVYNDTSAMQTAKEKVLEAMRNESPVILPPDNLEVRHVRTEDFTMVELFPSPDNLWAPFCRECGCEVRSTELREIHVNWHNKLLP